MKVWSTEIKELEVLYESFKGQLPDLEKELDKLVKADGDTTFEYQDMRDFTVESIVRDIRFKESELNKIDEKIKS